MNRQEIEQQLYEYNHAWGALKSHPDWEDVYSTKVIEGIYREARDWAVTLSDSGFNDPLTDSEKLHLIEEQLPLLESLINQAIRGGYSHEHIFALVVQRGTQTIGLIKKLYELLRF